jgi:hypothetical protein
MPKKLCASELYRQGRFNYADITHNPDGTTTITCAGVQAPAPYSFRVRNLGQPNEQLLDDPELEVEDVGAPLAAPPEG